MSEDPPGLFLSVRADQVRPQHHHIVAVHDIQNFDVRFQAAGGQQFTRRVNHHAHTLIVQQIDILAVEDKGIGGRRGVFQRDFKFSRPFPGKFGGVFAVSLPAALGQQDAVFTESK